MTQVNYRSNTPPHNENYPYISSTYATNNDSGRTLGELLAVLAIMGVLTLTAYAGYHYAINKTQANKIVQDARIFQLSATNMRKQTNTWSLVPDFISESNKEFKYIIDKKDHVFAKITGVEQEVCQKVIQTIGENYNVSQEDFSPLTQCDEVQTMILDYDKAGFPTECISVGDCEGDESTYCGKGRCLSCGEERDVNENGTGCVCFSGSELTCSDEEGNEWCCGTQNGKKTICSSEYNTCTVSNGACQYNMEQMSVEIKKKATCQYDMAQMTSTLVTQATCAYTLSISGNTVTFTKDPTKQCGSNEYCSINYKNDTCSTPLKTEDTGPLYGVCIPRDSNSTQCMVTSIQTSGGLTAVTKCINPNEYCYINYSQEDCSTPLKTEATGPLYGVCIPRDSNSAQCQIESIETSGGFNAVTLCPAGEYCLISWTQTGCTGGLSTGATGPLYGACISQENNALPNNWICPST